ncbi:hypothetical protein M8756_06625 [Lutimaribacter sp. EGI FJ00015]|uniref:Uncharacterized protein n=1 Tax=Lutimaribacter degradans TaxID=2945989 RepID=A0ACC5ZVB1_9RHOB|nr:hypothetical protein [Lutimaribacter sp. EGI FJ00013]MCM2561991.1 hypothetical protein [Lutimaribacter sp. EGI FJ00013]MCO0612977.1 hypothetical protein [Lutimaribacter sp. EGI FJ00015]MCO0635823.1 hypothetical protein [Lutimaribacter sp. EGI FJ00014]
MEQPRILRFYLDAGLRQSAEAGQHNFIGKIAQVAQDAGFDVEYHANSARNRAKSALRRGYAMFHMEPPTNDRGLTFRRAYHYPFWGIEPAAERWHWHVARTPFDPAQVPRNQADTFVARWRRRLFPDLAARDDGFVYVPLQGRLMDHRSFQSMAPVEMLECVLARDRRPVVATLHPKEKYTPTELDTLDRLSARHTRLTVEIGQMERFLPACSYVATQNSSAAFNGYFFEKPAVLFAQVDFHHIAANVPALGIDGAFDALDKSKPDYTGYLWWFWQEMSINAGRPEAEAQIATAMRRAGWPI